MYYDEEKLIAYYNAMMAKERGTKLHDLAAKCIELGEPLARKKRTLNMYVNDAIGYKMQPELALIFWRARCERTNFNRN